MEKHSHSLKLACAERQIPEKASRLGYPISGCSYHCTRNRGPAAHQSTAPKVPQVCGLSAGSTKGCSHCRIWGEKSVGRLNAAKAAVQAGPPGAPVAPVGGQVTKAQSVTKANPNVPQSPTNPNLRRRFPSTPTKRTRRLLLRHARLSALQRPHPPRPQRLHLLSPHRVRASRCR